MIIDDALITYLEDLSKIELQPQERESAKRELGTILDYMRKLSALDTAGVEGLSHPLAYGNVFREDEPQAFGEREALLQNAPRQKDGCFVAPKTVE